MDEKRREGMVEKRREEKRWEEKGWMPDERRAQPRGKGTELGVDGVPETAGAKM